jgi:ribosomal protein S18 acetylase RimI-like enzyme
VLPSLAKSLLDYNVLTFRELGFLWNVLLTEFKLHLRLPKSDASIEMFIVDSRYRGKGIGTQLLDMFLETARASGAKLVSLYTDDRMSNWQFYETHGFKRIGTFYDNITSHYSGHDSVGIIYAMVLDRSESGDLNADRIP